MLQEHDASSGSALQHHAGTMETGQASTEIIQTRHVS